MEYTIDNPKVAFILKTEIVRVAIWIENGKTQDAVSRRSYEPHELGDAQLEEQIELLREEKRRRKAKAKRELS